MKWRPRSMYHWPGVMQKRRRDSGASRGWCEGRVERAGGAPGPSPIPVIRGLLLLDDLVVRFDHVVGVAGGAGRSGLLGRLRRGGRGLLGRLGLVDLLPRRAEGLHQLIARAIELADVVLLERLLRALECGLETGLRVAGDLVAPLLQVLLDLVDQGVELVARLDLLLALPVLLGVRLGVLDHLLDLLLAETAGR